MAFSYSEMVLMAHGNNHKLYHYMTTDTSATIDTSGYFNDFADQLDLGDIIKAVTVDDVSNPTSVTGASEHVVVSNDGTTVDVSDTLLGSFADTD